MQDENYKTGKKIGNVSDAELDALLAEWAEGEMEPPIGFHAQTMKRLRAEARPQAQKAAKKQNNVVSLFAKHKRWTSVAAAAVLMLVCIPVVQGQLSDNVAGSLVGEQQSQQIQLAQSDNQNGDRAVNKEDRASSPSQSDTAKKQNGDTVDNKANDNKKDVAINATIGMEVSQGNVDSNHNDIDVAQLPPEDAGVPMMTSLEDDEVIGHKGRTMYVANAEKTLEELEQELEELQEQLTQYQEQLDAAPDDTNLQLIVKEQQQAIDDVKEKIEELKQEQK